MNNKLESFKSTVKAIPLFFQLLALILIGLKLSNRYFIYHWSWILILSPLWIPVILASSIQFIRKHNFNNNIIEKLKTEKVKKKIVSVSYWIGIIFGIAVMANVLQYYRG